MVFLLAWVRALGRLLRRDGSVQEPARKPHHHCLSREGERVQKLVRTIALDTHEPGCVGGPVARRGEAAERAACRSTSPGGIAVPGALPGFGLVAVTGRRWLLQALSGFPVAARVDSLAGVAGVALARLTERLAHTRPVQLSCLVAVDHVLDSSLAAGSTTRHAAVSRRPCREASKARDLSGRSRTACSPSPTRPPRPSRASSPRRRCPRARGSGSPHRRKARRKVRSRS